MQNKKQSCRCVYMNVSEWVYVDVLLENKKYIVYTLTGEPQMSYYI